MGGVEPFYKHLLRRKTNYQSQNVHVNFPYYLRVHQFNALPSVQYSWWEPS